MNNELTEKEIDELKEAFEALKQARQQVVDEYSFLINLAKREEEIKSQSQD